MHERVPDPLEMTMTPLTTENKHMVIMKFQIGFIAYSGGCGYAENVCVFGIAGHPGSALLDHYY
jgi:hypothetical protein